MRTDWLQQGGMYAGYLIFPAIYIGPSLYEAAWRDQGNVVAEQSILSSATPLMPQVVIPMRIKTLDEPIRQPKITEIDTIPTIDFVSWSDGTSQSLFWGASDPLQTSLTGTFFSPTTPVVDSHGSRFLIPQPTATPVTDYRTPPVRMPFDGVFDHPDYSLVLPNLTGMTYGDLIWAYLEGRFLRTSPSAFLRMDPTAYIDPFGNYYPNPVIEQFTCTAMPGNIAREQFSLSMWLET